MESLESQIHWLEGAPDTTDDAWKELAYHLEHNDYSVFVDQEDDPFTIKRYGFQQIRRKEECLIYCEFDSRLQVSDEQIRDEMVRYVGDRIC